MTETTIETVTGPLSSAELGFTLHHEHVFLDGAAGRSYEPRSEEARRTYERPIATELLADLAYDPFGCRDNLVLDDESLAIEEIARYAAAGGASIVDHTGIGWGRQPAALRRVSQATGVRIVAGTGYYVPGSRPKTFASMSIEDVEAAILDELTEGIEGTGVRAGFIGEIAVADPDRTITPDDERNLRGAARAQARAHVPMSVHLINPLAQQVLDILDEEGANLQAVVLCHIAQQALSDLDYQRAVVERGAWIGFDNIGVSFYRPEAHQEGHAQAPNDAAFVPAIRRAIEAGLTHRMLLSSDVFLKMMLVRHGGVGYAHLPRRFLPRLQRDGVSDETIRRLMVANPAAWFEHAAARGAPIGARTVAASA